MRAITIKKVHIYSIAMPYKTPFRASYGEQTHKIAVIIEVITADGGHGWGEASLEAVPRYGYETVATALHILHDFLIPLLQDTTIQHPADITHLLSRINGHPFTKAGLDAAIWDAYAKTNAMSLFELFREYVSEPETLPHSVKSGVVVGIQPTIAETLRIVEQRVKEGYRALKLKVVPAQNTQLLQTIRAEYPHLKILVDANGAYSGQDMDKLRELDEFDLLMVEQPFPARDFMAHQQVRTQLQTPICLDESIINLANAQLAHQLNAVDILNIKPARVGGFTEALNIYQFGRDVGLQMRVGGMLETGIGRASILQFAALNGLTLPADISATNRYFSEDITRHFDLNADGTLTPPGGLGISVDVDRVMLAKM